MTKDGSARPPRASRGPVRPAALRVGEAVLHRLRGQREARADAAARASSRGPGHAASYECCRVALRRRRSSSASSPASRCATATGSRRRFIRLTLPALPPWRWPGTFRAPARRRRRRARSRRWTPTTSTRSRSTPALAAPRHRPAAARRSPSAQAARRGLPAARARHRPAEHPARALYEAYGFGEREIRRAPDDRTARALGGPGFVGYLKDA